MSGHWSAAALVVLLALAGLGTYLWRASFLLLLGGDSLGPRLRRALTFIPPAALAALVFPPVLVRDGALALTADNERLIALAVAILAGWRTRNVLAVLGAGMAALWLLQWLGT